MKTTRKSKEHNSKMVRAMLILEKAYPTINFTAINDTRWLWIQWVDGPTVAMVHETLRSSGVSNSGVRLERRYSVEFLATLTEDAGAIGYTELRGAFAIPGMACEYIPGLRMYRDCSVGIMATAYKTAAIN